MISFGSNDFDSGNSYSWAKNESEASLMVFIRKPKSWFWHKILPVGVGSKCYLRSSPNSNTLKKGDFDYRGYELLPVYAKNNIGVLFVRLFGAFGNRHNLRQIPNR